ncbi:hypothetical protein Ancab_004684, partial [Ancistrocladus abbreviatus]
MATKSRSVVCLHLTLFFLVLVLVAADVDLFGENGPRQPPPSTPHPAKRKRPLPSITPPAPPQVPPPSTNSPAQLTGPPTSTPPPVQSTRRPPSTLPARIIDHYILALTWPWGFCNTSSCSANPVPDRFTIHGLWPVGPPSPGQKATTAKNSLHHCKTGQPLDKRITGSLSGLLEYYWPNVTTMRPADAEKFWEHEYMKHGSCCVPPLTQKEYFERPIELLQRYDILEQLLVNGNVKAGTPTKVSTIMKSFSGRQPSDIKEPIVKCRQSSKTTTKWYLTELYLCLDSSAQQFVNCSNIYKANNACGQSSRNIGGSVI